MQLFEVNLNNARAITNYGAIGVSVAGLLELSSNVAVNVLQFSPQSILPAHPAGRPQLFVVLHGHGWVSGADGRRSNLQAGQAVYWAAGEPHESGTEAGMLCIAVQSSNLDLPSGLMALEHPPILQLLSVDR